MVSGTSKTRSPEALLAAIIGLTMQGKKWGLRGWGGWARVLMYSKTDDFIAHLLNWYVASLRSAELLPHDLQP